MQGPEFAETAEALHNGDLDAAGLTSAERMLLEFVGSLTRHAYKITDEQVQALRNAGWSDAAVAEAIYNASIYNAVVRIADAFDINPHDIDSILPGADCKDATES